jgi:hypothetical protein
MSSLKPGITVIPSMPFFIPVTDVTLFPKVLFAIFLHPLKEHPGL